MSDAMTGFRQLHLLGPERVWRGQLQLAHPLGARDQDAVIRNHSMRLLAQRAEPATSAIEKQLPVVFHEPVLLAAATTTENYDGSKPGPSIEVLGTTFLPVAAAAKGWAAYSEVRLTPASPWPPKTGFKISTSTGNFEVSAPPLRLTQGAIRVGYAPDAPNDKGLSQRIDLKIGNGAPTTIFDSMRIARVTTVNGYGKPPKQLPAIAFDLTPDGIEFELDVPDPFLGAAEKWLQLRLRLEALGDAANPEMVLRLVGGDTASLNDLSRGLAWMSHDLAEREGAFMLQFDGTVVPPLMWPLTLVKGVYKAAGPVPAVRVAPEAVVARLLTPEDIDGGELGVAEFLRPRAELRVRMIGDPLTLMVESKSGEAEEPLSAGADVSLTWKPSADAPDGALQPDEVTIGGFTGAVDTDALAQRLGQLWGDAVATLPNRRAPFAFLALERGWLQLPLPAKPAPRSDARARSAFNGFVRVDIPPATATSPRETLPGVDIFSARRIRTLIEWNAPFSHAERTTTVELHNAVGTVSGLLWAGEASPTPVEILPSLAAGPAALVSVPIMFGNAAATDWRLEVAEIKPRPADITIHVPPKALTLAWRAHDSQALLSAIAMTRTAENALRPSTTRDLVPVEVKPGALKLMFDGGARLPSTAFTANGANPHGLDQWRWPWPPLKAVRAGATPSSPVEAAGVSLVSLTTAGVEFTVAEGESTGFPGLRFSLRYDLPLLDELFATTTAPAPNWARPAGDEDARKELPPTALEPERLAATWTESARRLARARTDADRVHLAGSEATPTLWHMPEVDVRETRVEGLFEPYKWTPASIGFRARQGDLNIGGYNAGDKWRSGPGTLDGLDANFSIDRNALTLTHTPTAGDLNVSGFATGSVTTGTFLQDARGLALAKESEAPNGLRYRAAQLHWTKPPGALRLATLSKPIEIDIAGKSAHFWFRDLPLAAAASKLTFDQSGGLETAPGPDPAALGSRRLPAALYEWRFYNHDPDEQPRYELKLSGPLNFRPLRLAALELGIDGSPQRLEIIGSVQIGPPDQDAVSREPFGPDRAYATGNLVRLSFTAGGSGLVLAAAERVTYDASRRAFDTSKSPLAFAVQTEVAAVLSSDTPPDLVESVVDLHLAATAAGGKLTFAKAELHIRLFGQECTLSTPSPTANDTGLSAVFKGTPQGVLGLSELVFDWTAGAPERPRLLIQKGVLAVPLNAGKNAPSVLARTYGTAPDMRWLGLTGLAAREQIDHANGVVTITIETDLAADQSLFRGLLLRAGKLRASIVLVFRLGKGIWPAPQIGSAIAEFTFDAALTDRKAMAQRVTALRHRHIGDFDDESASGTVVWASRLLIDAKFAASRSTIEWPVESIDVAPLFEPKPKEPKTWKKDLKVAKKGLVLNHHVQPRLCAHELPVELLVSERSEIILDRPWRIRAAVDHVMAPLGEKPDPAKHLAWSSIDEIALFDMGRLLQAARADAEIPAGEKEAHAFLARYQAKHDEIRVAGVVRRTLANAGFPVRRILAAVHQTYPGSAEAPKHLVLTGAAVTDVVIPPAALGEPPAGERREWPMGVTVMPQWVLPWVAPPDGEPPESIKPLGLIRQVDDQPQSYEIAAYDAAAGNVRALERTAASPFGAQDGTQSLIEVQLRKLGGGEILPHLMAADQTFVVTPKGKKAEDDPPLLTRPLMVRTLLALKTIMTSFDKAAPRDWREGIACVVGRTDKGRELRLAVGTWPDDGALDEATSPAVAVMVLDRSGVKGETLPEPLAATLVDPAGPGLLADGSERADAMLRALSHSSHPLRVVLARADPSYMTIRLREARGSADGTGPLAEVRALPPHVGWVTIEAPPAMLAQPQTRVLRARAETVYASAALGWPQAGDEGDLASAQARIGDEQVRRNTTDAWAGRVRSLAWPAKAWAAGTAEMEMDRAVFIALGQRAALRRQTAHDLRTAPDRVSTIAPPRARAPVAGALRDAFEPARTPLLNKEDSEERRSRLAPMLPASLEVTVTGQRPGVFFTQHEGVLMTTAQLPFDSAFDRFGRPAVRGPLIVRQLRAPRSSALPDTEDLALRRRTFVAEDERHQGKLKPFKLMTGPALVTRFESADRTKAVTFRFFSPALGWIGADWDGKLELDSSVPTGSCREALAEIGLLVQASAGDTETRRAQLQVGDVAIDMTRMEWSATTENDPTVRLTFEAPENLDPIRAALRNASADTPVRFTIRCREAGSPAAGPAGSVALATKSTSLVPGPPRVLSFDLPHLPADRRWVPVSTFTLAFGDPAYDRELGSPSWTVKAAFADVPYTMAADRAEFDLSNTVHFAFWKDDGKPVTGDWALSVGVQPADGSAVRRLAIAGIEALPNTTCYAVLSMQAYALPIPALRETEVDLKGMPARLRQGDRLELALTGPNNAALLLTVGLVAEPVLPAPAATYGLAVLRGAESLATALFATAPLPQSIEFPSLLKDLIAGHVRRRALFLWPFATARPFQTGAPFAYLVKVDRTGGGQLPDSRDDFLPYEG
ncbi:hypothetical protein NKH48_27125 [Mesorhizobium sp. M1233]|uniref:hypothetical protein n=1 Tax=Mesorhizobium sp. M1233 TaxID=2957072 RepID=UPI00333A01AE